eukprot:5287855-Prymnesium_polylepis.1
MLRRERGRGSRQRLGLPARGLVFPPAQPVGAGAPAVVSALESARVGIAAEGLVTAHAYAAAHAFAWHR